MIQGVELYNSTLPQQQKITISVEIEKTREALYQLFAHGDVVGVSQMSSNIRTSQSCFSLSDLSSGVLSQVFISKNVALHFGFQSAQTALKGLYSRVKQG